MPTTQTDQSQDPNAKRIGRLVTTVAFNETVNAYVPQPLPPSPPLVLSDELLNRLSEADRAVGRLDGVAMLLPDKALFLYMYVRKEAVLSSQIEERSPRSTICSVSRTRRWQASRSTTSRKFRTTSTR